MSEAYEEILEGEARLRPPPGDRHEVICGRLHERVAACLAGVTVSRLLAPRSLVEMAPGLRVRPDLALVTTATHKLWLAAEVVSSEDHHADTVIKKALYEEQRLARLWMVDPRYNNVEVYHGNEYGLALKEILAMNDVLRETLLPEFEYRITDLFHH